MSTVREAEFRSRWTDYQVDKAKTKSAQGEADAATKESLLTKFTQFGPLEFHGGLTTGWEYSNEKYTLNNQTNPSSNSFFVAPSLLATYQKTLGTWDIGASYSVGWLYYLDPNYVGSNGDVTTSQTANVTLLRMNERVTIRSTTNASSGTGFDIQRGQATDRVAVGENFSIEYQLTEYMRTGVSGSFGSDTYSTPGGANSAGDTTNYRYAGAIFLDNFWTDKTAYRLELSAGSDMQDNGGNSTNDRTYAQGVIRVNYGPTSKLAFTGSIGLGVRDQTQTSSNSENGLRTVYSLSTTYTPSEKTSIRLYVGIEGAASLPEFTLAVNWHPREFTFLELSIYQQTGLSNFTSTDERLSKGFLLSFRQRFFARLDASLSGGYEQNASIINGSTANEEDPYSFAAIGLGWQMNTHLSLQTQIRTSKGRNSLGSAASGQQTRASMSLSLTF
ncbi:MAG: hypothetical protein ABIT76_00810 [Chthoniobacterales bacterium]